MHIYEFLGESISEPIIDRNMGNISSLNEPTEMSDKNLLLQSSSGKIMNYTLLHYKPGLTTLCAIEGRTIITGYMSGCYLFRFRKAGKLYCAHVGTHDSDKSLTNKSKQMWKVFVEDPSITEIVGCDPLNDLSMDLLIKAQQQFGSPQIIGIWDANGSFRTAILCAAKGVFGRKTLAAIEYARVRPWEDIKHDPKMQI